MTTAGRQFDSCVKEWKKGGIEPPFVFWWT
jgi:hypothetical protein